ncbi:MAG: FMN-binding negative transcriptional regulator, partial [Planctomycetota bacterium]
PAAYFEQLLKGIIGFEMPITTLQGKFKLSQNRSTADQDGAIAGLLARGDAESVATAEAMKRAQQRPRERTDSD